MAPKLQIKSNFVDRVVGMFDPAKELDRLRSRAAISYMEDSGYVVPGGRKRAMRGWNPLARSADQDSIPKLNSIRSGARDLVMNTPLAGAALNRELTNVVGWGLSVQCRIDRDLLGLSDEQADAWERATEREFKLWSNTVDCDSERTSTFNELQALALYNTSLSGDIFALLPHIPRDGVMYDLRIKLIESDYCSNPDTKLDTTLLAGGIEVDTNGAPVAYYFVKANPDDPLTSSIPVLTGKWVKIPAYGAQSQRRNVLHLFHKKRPGQRRGMPLLAPVIELLKQIARLTEAELMASVIASFFTVFVKTNPAMGGLTEGFIPSDRVSDSSNPSDQNIYEMGNGNIIELGGEGQSIEVADPKRPNGAFEPFYIALVKQIGSAIEIPYEQLILHFDSSYSAARGAILEAWKFYRQRRNWLAQKFNQPIYEEWMTEAILKGRIVAPGFFDDPIIKQAWCGTYWGGPGQGQINPAQETQAAVDKIQNYLSTYEEEYSSIHGGTDWTGALDRNAREVNAIKQRNLPVPSPKSAAPNAFPTEQQSQPQTPSNPPGE